MWVVDPADRSLVSQYTGRQVVVALDAGLFQPVDCSLVKQYTGRQGVGMKVEKQGWREYPCIVTRLWCITRVSMSSQSKLVQKLGQHWVSQIWWISENLFHFLCKICGWLVSWLAHPSLGQCFFVVVKSQRQFRCLFVTSLHFLLVLIFPPLYPHFTSSCTYFYISLH